MTIDRGCIKISQGHYIEQELALEHLSLLGRRGLAGVGGDIFFFFQASASGQYDKDIMDNEDVSFYSTVFGHQD